MSTPIEESQVPTEEPYAFRLSSQDFHRHQIIANTGDDFMSACGISVNRGDVGSLQEWGRLDYNVVCPDCAAATGLYDLDIGAVKTFLAKTIGDVLQISENTDLNPPAGLAIPILDLTPRDPTHHFPGKADEYLRHLSYRLAGITVDHRDAPLATYSPILTLSDFDDPA